MNVDFYCDGVLLECKSYVGQNGPPKPKFVQVNIRLPIIIAEQMRKIRIARWRADGDDPKLSRIYREAAESFIRTIDFETGWPKRRCRVRSNPPPQ